LKKKILNTLKYLAFSLLGVLLFWLVYRGQDFSRIWNYIVTEVNYFWIAMSLLLGLLSHISRTLRWKIALEPLGENPRTINAFIAVMVAYFMNLLLPRAGELARCALLSKYEKIDFSKLLGTVLAERAVDVIMLFLAFLAVVLLEFDKVTGFIDQNPDMVNNVISLLRSPLLWAGALVALSGLVFLFYFEKRKGKKSKLKTMVGNFAKGIRSILAMRRYKAYIAHSFFIWTMYFLMLYMVFLSLGFTSGLGLLSALTTFVFTSFGMLAPVQGGIGAWHFMAEKALGLYGVESADGKLFALIAHSSMNLFILICGAICIIVIPLVNKGYIPKKGNI
jgi:glycosyltransferase 2 family protein